MKIVKLIKDPLYLARQALTDVKHHQIPGLLVHIKAMVVLCRKNQLGSMSAPEAGLPYNFFIAANPDPRDHDYDVVFAPAVTPLEEYGTKAIEELAVDGTTYRVPRWRKVRMSWQYHNGSSFEERTGEFEGEVAYIAQRQCDRLHGEYIDANSGLEAVVIPKVQP